MKPFFMFLSENKGYVDGYRVTQCLRKYRAADKFTMFNWRYILY